MRCETKGCAFIVDTVAAGAGVNVAAGAAGVDVEGISEGAGVSA